MDALEHRDILKRAESMKLFERDGSIYYGPWRRWWRAADQQERDAILAEFRRQPGPDLP